jgi:hypothetical protein
MSLLSYHLTSPPDLLRACHVGRSVFHARISNQNVANFVVPRGFLELNRLRFHLHSSELQASAMANALKVDEGVIAPHPPAAVASCFVSTCRCQRPSDCHARRAYPDLKFGSLCYVSPSPTS